MKTSRFLVVLVGLFGLLQTQAAEAQTAQPWTPITLEPAPAIAPYYGGKVVAGNPYVAPTAPYAAYAPSRPAVASPASPYRPVWPVVTVPPNYYVGRGILGQVKLYVPGQPLRNALRYLTP